MTEIQLTGIILCITGIIMAIIACVAFAIGTIIAWRETPKKERKGLKCLAGIHKWRYVSTPLREVWWSPRRQRLNKVFTASYYNKKVTYCVKYCLKCLKFKAEKA